MTHSPTSYISGDEDSCLPFDEFGENASSLRLTHATGQSDCAVTTLPQETRQVPCLVTARTEDNYPEIWYSRGEKRRVGVTK